MFRLMHSLTALQLLYPRSDRDHLNQSQPTHTVWQDAPPPGLGSILDTVSNNTEVQPLLYLYLRYIFSQLLSMVSVSKYLKDTEDTAPHVSVSVS